MDPDRAAPPAAVTVPTRPEGDGVVEVPLLLGRAEFAALVDQAALWRLTPAQPLWRLIHLFLTCPEAPDPSSP